MSYIDTSLSWRLPIGLQIIFAVLLIAGVSRLPESPRYLLSTGQHLEGEHVVAALSAQTVDSEETQQEKRIIVEALESVGELQIKHVFTSGPSQHFRRTLIGASSQLFQQIGECNNIAKRTHSTRCYRRVQCGYLLRARHIRDVHRA